MGGLTNRSARQLMKKRLLSSSPKLFTPEAANKTLPLVSAILSDLAPLWSSVQSSQRRIKHLTENREPQVRNLYSEELDAMKQKLARDTSTVESLVDELRDIGIEFKNSGTSCHVCFPTMLEGRLVYLSWQLGEPEVSHWMDLDGEFSDRQSLFAVQQ